MNSTKVFCWLSKKCLFIKYHQLVVIGSTGNNNPRIIDFEYLLPQQFSFVSIHSICDLVVKLHQSIHIHIILICWTLIHFFFGVDSFSCVCRAANWNLSEPLWTGRMKLIAKGVTVSLKLEDKNTGALYANCPVETYPGKL